MRGEHMVDCAAFIFGAQSAVVEPTANRETIPGQFSQELPDPDVMKGGFTHIAGSHRRWGKRATTTSEEHQGTVRVPAASRLTRPPA